MNSFWLHKKKWIEKSDDFSPQNSWNSYRLFSVSTNFAMGFNPVGFFPMKKSPFKKICGNHPVGYEIIVANTLFSHTVTTKYSFLLLELTELNYLDINHTIVQLLHLCRPGVRVHVHASIPLRREHIRIV
jgi:hypothetical protein